MGRFPRGVFALPLVLLVLTACGPVESSPAPDANEPSAEGDPAAHVARTVAAVPPVSIEGSFRHRLRSEAIGQDFLIDVVLPRTPSDEPLPVIYVTDGNSMLPIVANTARLLQLGGELPPAIIVGIGYEVSTPEEVMALRMRELTPTVGTTPEGMDPPMIPPGGAAAFLDFIEREVKPLVASQYPIDPSDATLVGDSLGGLFTLYALFNRTTDYQRYIAGSPSLWWDGEMLLADEAAFAERTTDVDADVFVSVGSLEEVSAPWAKMVTNTRVMAERLAARDYANLRLTSHVFEGETHLSVIPATFSRGLRAVFARDVAAMQEKAAAEAATAEATAD